jgi:RNase P/RNase MRP subunit p30
LNIIKEVIEKEQKKTKIKLHFGLLVEAKQVNKARSVCDFVLVKSTGDDQIILEKSKPDIIYDLELVAKKDKLNFRLSGLNQVLCKLASKNKVIVGFSFSLIFNAKNRVMILGRIIQNIRLCRKYKVDTAFASFARNLFELRAWHDLISFLIVLGMQAGKAKKSFRFAADKIKLNQKKKLPEYIREGVKVLK